MILVSTLLAAVIAQTPTTAPAATPRRPDLSEIFESKVAVDFREGHHHGIGEGHFVVDQPNNRSLERFDFYGRRDPFWLLQRYDLGFVYRIDEHKKTCNADPVKGAMPSVWGWVQHAAYEGQKDFKKRKLDMWAAKPGHNLKTEVGVYANEITRPSIYRRHHIGGEILYEFFTWHTSAVNQTHFKVPDYCP